MRLAVYTDYRYRRDDDGVSGELAFVRFMTALRPLVDELVLVGRLDPAPGRSHYPLGDDVGFVGLPWYGSLTEPAAVLRSLARSVGRLWRALDDVDTAWVMGPYPHAIAFALVALARRRRVVLGVRQDFPAYVRSRRPSSRWTHRAADALEWAFRRLARRLPVAAVGPDLARRYGHAPAVLELTVSLVSDADLVPADIAVARSHNRVERVLSVGRIDREKNPLLLADVLAELRADGVPWRLEVAGDGPLRSELQRRLEQRGVAGAAVLHGYVPVDDGLAALYRSADVFLHVSWTEGLPQVLFEAFAAGTPVVATDVGGVAEAAGGAALLVPPGDAAAAAEAVRRVRGDRELRERLVRAGAARVRAHTLEAESRRLVAFIAACGAPRGSAATGRAASGSSTKE